MSAYLAEVVTRYSEAEAALRSIVARTGDGRAIARQIRAKVVDPGQVLLDDVRSLCIEDADVRGVHEESVTALELAVQAFTEYSDAHDRGDADLLERAIQVRAEEVAHWQQWQAGVAQLEEEARGG